MFGLRSWELQLELITEAWYEAGQNSVRPEKLQEEAWAPKNPELVLLYTDSMADRDKMVGLGQSEREDPGEVFWKDPRIPFHPAPLDVSTHINTGAWQQFMDMTRVAQPPGWRRQLELAESVLHQLTQGASSGVWGKGLENICVENHFEDLQIDAPRMLDALLQAIKSGYITGPHPLSPSTIGRINGFLSIPKPGGERRQVGDMSSPKGLSFNCNVDKEMEQVWPMTQLTAKKFSWMIKRMGVGALMGKSDLSQAYKCLPVSLEQRALQWFRFGNRMVGELRLVFGDCYAPKYFDRFHHVLLEVFVLIPNKISLAILGKCIDDIPVVVPWNRQEWLEKFFYHYRRVCDILGVKISSTHQASKSFQNRKVGEVLGIEFDTTKMSWAFPRRKRMALLYQLHEVSSAKVALNPKQWEVVTGKLIDFYQLWPAGKFFIDSFLQMVHSHPTQKRRRLARRDAKVWIAVLEYGELPILPPPGCPPPDHIQSFSDASGDLWDTPSVGILIPAQYGRKPRVASWEFPRGFLVSLDESGVMCRHKTTALEAVGPLATLLLAPDLLQGRSLLHKVISDQVYLFV